jgi:hypothetical protein
VLWRADIFWESWESGEVLINTKHMHFFLTSTRTTIYKIQEVICSYLQVLEQWFVTIVDTDVMVPNHGAHCKREEDAHNHEQRADHCLHLARRSVRDGLQDRCYIQKCPALTARR